MYPCLISLVNYNSLPPEIQRFLFRVNLCARLVGHATERNGIRMNPSLGKISTTPEKWSRGTNIVVTRFYKQHDGKMVLHDVQSQTIKILGLFLFETML